MKPRRRRCPQDGAEYVSEECPVCRVARIEKEKSQRREFSRTGHEPPSIRRRCTRCKRRFSTKSAVQKKCNDCAMIIDRSTRNARNRARRAKEGSPTEELDFS